jgi:hypothetical protein
MEAYLSPNFLPVPRRTHIETCLMMRLSWRGQRRDAPEIERKLCSVLQCVQGERGKI